MSSVLENYNVFVSTICYVEAQEYASTPGSTIRVEAMNNYCSDETANYNGRDCTQQLFNKAKTIMPKEIKDPTPKQTSFSSERGSLTWDDVSRMISEPNIPFTLGRLRWKREGRDRDWTHVSDKEKIVKHILGVVSHEESRACNNAVRKALVFHVIIKKVIILPHGEFKARVETMKVEEVTRGTNRLHSWMQQQQTNHGVRFSPDTYHRMIREAWRENGLPQTSLESLAQQAVRESAEQARIFKPMPAAKSAIEELKDAVVVRTETCAICMETMTIGSLVTRMPPPCCHEFHKPCISTWVQHCHTCPLCRFPLQTS